MAKVSSFYQIRDRDGKAHPTSVECGYFVFKDQRQGTVLQIETGGSGSREYPGKVSQTLQFDAASAKDFIAILSKTFPSNE
jgi:hypothetical protein